MTAPARRELVRHLVDKGLSERRSLAVVRMSASAYRYAPRPDRIIELQAGDVFFAGLGCEHVAHPQGAARILVAERQGSV